MKLYTGRANKETIISSQSGVFVFSVRRQRVVCMFYMESHVNKRLFSCLHTSIALMMLLDAVRFTEIDKPELLRGLSFSRVATNISNLWASWAALRWAIECHRQISMRHNKCKMALRAVSLFFRCKYLRSLQSNASIGRQAHIHILLCRTSIVMCFLIRWLPLSQSRVGMGQSENWYSISKANNPFN